MNRWWLVAALAAVCVGALLIFSCGRTEHTVNNYYDDDDSGDDDVSADDDHSGDDDTAVHPGDDDTTPSGDDDTTPPADDDTTPSYKCPGYTGNDPCCRTNNPCQWDNDGDCDCGGFCDWDWNDCHGQEVDDC
jgi:hypothetical protein